MRTLAVLAATLAITLTFAATASAQSVSITTSKTDEFGNKQSITKTRNSDGSESISKFTKDALGNKQRVTKTHNADGSESFSKFSADADGKFSAIAPEDARAHLDLLWDRLLDVDSLDRRSQSAGA